MVSSLWHFAVAYVGGHPVLAYAARPVLLPAIGLALDLVGAVALTFGLYSHSRALYPGLTRGPADVARDAAFGAVGATLLVAGFTMQSLQYMGITVECARGVVAGAAVGTLALAALYAYAVYGLVTIYVFRREYRWVSTTHPDLNLPQMQRVRRGLRFWLFEVVPPQ